MREGIFETLFVRHGSGSHFVKRFTASKAWNYIAWALIVLGSLAWVAFLRWNPAGE